MTATMDVRPITHDTLVAQLRYRASHEPEQLAFGFASGRSDEEIQYTYATLDLAARRIGAALQLAGMSGERAILLYQPGPDYICALMACMYADTVAVPVYAPRPNASYDRVLQVIASARAKILLTSEKILANLNQSEWDGLKQPNCRWLATDTLPETLASEWKMPNIDGDSLAILQYTSGSTGYPKGVMLCHRHLLTNSRMIARAMGCSRDSVGVIWLPPYHDMGLIGGLLQPIYSGFPVHLMSPVTFMQRPIRWLEAIDKYRGTISAAPNFAYDLCVKRIRAEQLASLDLSSWKVAANGAEPIRAETLRQFSATFSKAGFDERAFFSCFGMAETTLYVTGSPLFSGVRTLRASRAALALATVMPGKGEHDEIELVSSGIADPEVKVRIVNPQTRQMCEDGEVGEIWVSGATVAAGYWEQYEKNQDSFHARMKASASDIMEECLATDRFTRVVEDCAANWLRTGDLGSMVGGELYVTGRIKDLIIIRGQNHYPHDIEMTVNALHPALRAQGIAAFCIDTVEGESLGLVLEVEREYLDIDLEPVAVVVREAISASHQLQIERLAFVRAGHIPRTSSGKIQRFLAKQRLLSGELKVIEVRHAVTLCP